MALAGTRSTSLRVKIIGHETVIDPSSRSNIIQYRTVALFNGQKSERALRYSKFYNFYINMKPSEKKAIDVKFPPRHPFTTVLTDKMIQKREKMLNAYLSAVCATPLSAHTEAALHRLLDVHKLQGNNALPPVSETSSVREVYTPVSRIFTSASNRFDEAASYCSSVRSSMQLLSSSSSDIGRVASEPEHSTQDVNEATTEKEVDEDEDDSLFEEALTDPVAVISPNQLQQAALNQMNKVNSLLVYPTQDDSTKVDDIQATNYQDAIDQQLSVIHSILKPSTQRFEEASTTSISLQHSSPIL